MINENELKSTESVFNLILHNDEIHNMFEITLALIRICGLSDDISYSKMEIAHNEGTAVLLESSEAVIIEMKQKFDELGITTTIEIKEAATE